MDLCLKKKEKKSLLPSGGYNKNFNTLNLNQVSVVAKEKL